MNNWSRIGMDPAPVSSKGLYIAQYIIYGLHDQVDFNKQLKQMMSDMFLEIENGTTINKQKTNQK